MYRGSFGRYRVPSCSLGQLPRKVVADPWEALESFSLS